MFPFVPDKKNGVSEKVIALRLARTQMGLVLGTRLTKAAHLPMSDILSRAVSGSVSRCPGDSSGSIFLNMDPF